MKTYSKNQLQRYPIYLKYLKKLEAEGVKVVSSPMMAKELGYSEEQIRKDLQNVSDRPGRPHKGRDVHVLIETLESFLGYRTSTKAVMIGAGHLGAALMNYPNFEEMGLSIVAAFDTDPAKIGAEVRGKAIYSMSDFETLWPHLDAEIAIICVPAEESQKVVDLAIKAGAKGIWNFAPNHINVPKSVSLVTTNLASSLAVLSHSLNVKK